MSTRLDRRSKRQFEKQRTPKPGKPVPGVVQDLRAMQDAGLAHLAYLRANAWALSPSGTPYGGVAPVAAKERSL